MSVQDLKNAISENSISVDLADKYLRLYVAPIDWKPHISSMWLNATKKYKDDDLAKNHIKKAISCATILPLVEKIQIPDPASNLLFWCTGWKQFNDRDWLNLFMQILKEDLDISIKRNEIIKFGVIDPIDVSPITRQAYNWIYEKVSEEEFQDKESFESVKEKIKNLVRAYGGAVICNVFLKHKKNIDDVLNWRSGYFLEKQIHKVYSMDQIVKIKKAELSKTNSKYIKKVGT